MIASDGPQHEKHGTPTFMQGAMHRSRVTEPKHRQPWDRKQTWESLRTLTIEETYELADAIVDNDAQGIKEELGDLMLHLDRHVADVGAHGREVEPGRVLPGDVEHVQAVFLGQPLNIPVADHPGGFFDHMGGRAWLASE